MTSRKVRDKTSESEPPTVEAVIVWPPSLPLLDLWGRRLHPYGEHGGGAAGPADEMLADGCLGLRSAFTLGMHSHELGRSVSEPAKKFIDALVGSVRERDGKRGKAMSAAGIDGQLRRVARGDPTGVHEQRVVQERVQCAHREQRCREIP